MKEQKITSIKEFYELNNNAIEKIRKKEYETELIDEHESKPDIKVDINEIGACSMSVWIRVKLEGHEVYKLNPTIKASVNLKNGIKGLHMSRHPEAIYRAIAESWCIDLEDIHKLGDRIACNLLESHEYSTKSIVQLHMKLPYYKQTENNVWCESNHELFFLSEAQKSEVQKSDKIKITTKSIKVSVDGVTVCPTGQSLVKDYYKEVANGCEQAAFGTHMQRARGEVTIKIINRQGIRDDDIRNIFDIPKLIEVMESSMSSSTFNLVKRLDEQALIVNALKKPRFIEDCIRHSAKNLVDKFSNIPDDAEITIFFKSLESFHQYDLYARLSSSFLDLKKQLIK